MDKLTDSAELVSLIVEVATPDHLEHDIHWRATGRQKVLLGIEGATVVVDTVVDSVAISNDVIEDFPWKASTTLTKAQADAKAASWNQSEARNIRNELQERDTAKVPTPDFSLKLTDSG